MDRSFHNIKVFGLEDKGLVTRKFENNVSILLEYDPHGLNLKCFPGNEEKPVLLEFLASKDVDYSRVGKQSCVFHVNSNTILFSFSSVAEFQPFHQVMMKLRTGQHLSVFNERTDEASSVQYFQFYGYLSQQQNMMQDYIRTSTYQRALLSNLVDFKDKIVLDVGAGSGILSFFAVQAGARKVYAVEASSMATHAETLVKANNLQNRITVIAGKIEEISLPEKVDVIVSEPMGYMLFNERMLETFLHAKKWLNPNGKMFPTKGDLHIVPFTDDALYMEQFNKANFWYQQCFHGVNLVSLRTAAIEEYFRQPIVDTFDIRICMSKSQRYTVDFQTALEDELHQIEIPLEFHLLQSGTIHGLAFWFDVAFIGTAQTVWLSTAPTEPLTHWYQVRCLLETPLFAKIGQMLTGKVVLSSNKRQSYDVTIELVVEGTNIKSNNTLDLKNPYFRYTGQPSQSPPGYNCASPSEAYWQQLDEQGARQALNLVNGIQVNGIGDIAMDTSPAGGLVSALANQANIHPGSIPATGQKQGVSSNPNSRSCPSSSSQLIGGAISPNMLTQNPTHQIVLGNTSHYPVSNNLMIGDYVAPTTVFLSPQSINSTFRT